MGERNFQGIWIPAELWLDKTIPLTEKILFLEIQSLDNELGCIKTNKSLSNFLGVNPTTVSHLLKSMESKGLISITYSNYNTFEGRSIRVLSTPWENRKGGCENHKAPCENRKHSNTISNTYSINSLLDVDIKKSTVYSDIVDYWLKEFHIGWTFTAMHGKSINSIISKIKSVQKDQKKETTDGSILESFKLICENLPDWYKDKDLPILNSKFNEIMTEIKNRKNGKSITTKQHSSEAYRFDY